MKRWNRLLTATVLGLLLAGLAAADTLELKDGRVLRGKYLGGTQAVLRFEVKGEVQTFSTIDIVALTFTGRSAGGTPAARPVNVSATISIVLNVCTSPFTSKRSTACVPPRYFPRSTRPSFNSKVSAAAKPASNRPSTVAVNKRFHLFMVSSQAENRANPRDLREFSPHPQDIVQFYRIG